MTNNLDVKQNGKKNRKEKIKRKKMQKERKKERYGVKGRKTIKKKMQ